MNNPIDSSKKISREKRGSFIFQLVMIILVNILAVIIIISVIAYLFISNGSNIYSGLNVIKSAI